MGTQFTVLTGFCIALSLCIWSSLEVKGGLGKEERENRFKEKHEPQSRVHHGTESGCCREVYESNIFHVKRELN